MHVSDSAANPAPTAADDDLGELLLEVLPPGGSTHPTGQRACRRPPAKFLVAGQLHQDQVVRS